MDEENHQTEMMELRADIESLKLKVESTRRLVVWGAVGGAVVSILTRLLIPAPAHHAPIHAPAPATIETGNVTIGEARPESRKVYLTVSEVASRENVADRTITEWIGKGVILPQPERTGRAWRIAADYRILPQTAAITATTETQ